MPRTTLDIPSIIRRASVVDSAVDFAIIITDRDGLVTDWNTGAENILGWTADEMNNQNVERIFTPEDRAIKRADFEMQTALCQGRANDERWHMRKDGTHFWASGEMMPLMSIENEHEGFVKILRDRTEEHESGLALEEALNSEEQSRAVLDSIEVGFCIIEIIFDHRMIPIDYLFVDTNSAFERQGGPINALGRTIRSINPMSEQHWLTTYGGVALTGKPVRFENHSGDRWFEAYALRVGRKQNNRVAVLFTDITARKQKEWDTRGLIEERTRERDRLWDLSTDVIVVTTSNADILSINPAWSTLFDWSPEDLIGKNCLDFIHPDDLSEAKRVLSELSNKVNIFKSSTRFRRKDNTYRWLCWNAIPDGDLIYAIGRDIQAEIEQADALQKTEEALRQSQKMEAVGQLTGGIAHDFNNLLSAITGCLEMMQAKVKKGRYSELDKYTSLAQSATQRAAALTHRLLAFSRRQTLAPKPTDINKLVHGLLEMVKRTVGPTIEIAVDCQPELWKVRVDGNQLENAFLNLCINARDAMPEGGHIHIKTKNHTFTQADITDSYLKTGDYVTFCVSDTGTGMTQDVLQKAFEPFFTTKPIGEGTGLGLSMIYGFARQSGGQAHIDSEVGHGTTVCLYLPRDISEHTEAKVIEQNIEIQPLKQAKTILVVDDEPTVRMLVVDLLEECGYTILEAGDGQAGLKHLQSDSPIDLLVTDVGLPGGMNGRQMVELGMKQRPDLKVLYITGYAEGDALNDGHFDDSIQVMTKPFALDVLMATIQGMVDSK